MMRKLLHTTLRTALVVLLLVAVGCSKQNPDYCNAETPCTDPVRSLCDVLRSECIEPPDQGCASSAECTTSTTPICETTSGDCMACVEGVAGDADCAAKDPTRPFCDADGSCVAGCQSSGECPISEPICSAAMTCELCDAAGTGDANCAARDASMPVCASDGACVECDGDGDCAIATAPVCELATNVCRGCAANSECSSEVCDSNSGACIMTTNIVYVDGSSGADGPSCGTMPSPCATIAGAQGGLAKVTIMRDTVRVRAGVYVESVTVGAGQTVTFVGPATVSPPTLSDTPSLLVNGGSNVTLVEMTLAGADGGNNADGVRCEASSTLHLLRATIDNNDATGVQATDCTVTIEQSTISGNQGGGISINNSDFTIRNNFVAANGVAGGGGMAFGGVSINNSGSFVQVLEFNTIADSKAQTAAIAAGVFCSVSQAMTASNNIVYLTTGGTATVFGPNCTWTYSDIEGGQAGTGNIDMDPLFVNVLTGDFHLMPNSPARNAADPAATLTIDVDGQSRPEGARHDIGADEVVE